MNRFIRIVFCFLFSSSFCLAQNSRITFPIFEDVSEHAGITATHRAIYDDKETMQGYLAIGQAWGDYDNDGWLDLYVANWSCFPECDPVDFARQQDRFYRNNGDGTFSDVTNHLDYDKTLGAGFITYWIDYDNDNDLDLYVINDYLHNPIGNVLWRNDGTGCQGWCWTDVSIEHGLMLIINGMGVDSADYDRDGDLDLYITDMVYQMHLMTGDDSGYFRNHSMQAGVAINTRPDHGVGWGTVFFDYDNDGWQDLYVAMTRYHQTFPELVTTFINPRPDLLYRNVGDGTFDDISRQSGTNAMLATLGVAYADYDRDGDLDLVTGNWDMGYRLYRNRTRENSNHNWISVKLIGDDQVNRDAVGSKVFIITDDGATQLQTVTIGSGLGGNNQRALHFGLGKTTIQMLRVVWTDGSECEMKDVAVNQQITIGYDETQICILRN